MTIRQYLRVRLFKAAVVLGGAVVIFAAVRFALFPGIQAFWIFFAAWGCLVALNVYLSYFIECPKCLNPLGREALGIAFPALTVIPRNYCQSCGKDVDEPI
jgi:hypothetical protein